MLEDYDGADVYGADGEKIGSVDHTYVDANNVPKYVGLTMGGLIRKHRLVPLDEAETADDGLHVPFTKDAVANSPDASDADGDVPADLLDGVAAYYGGLGTGGAVSGDAADDEDGADLQDDGPSFSDRVSGAVQGIKNAVTDERDDTAGPDSASRDTSETTDSIPSVGGQVGQVRDLGDVIEVPVVEEEIVKRPVVREVVRIRKNQTSDVQTVEGDVRSEDVEVIPSGDVTVTEPDSEG
jgi:hypothetical protein